MATVTQPQLDQSAEVSQESSESGSSRPQPKQKSVLAKGWNTTMKLVRRIHLYSGLFMFPWVLLYGVTGMFFNHPRWFTGAEVQSFTAQSIPSEELGKLSGPDQMAANIVAEINRSLSESAQGDEAVPKVVLTDRRPPQYNSFFTFTVRNDDAEHTITINPVTGDGEVRTSPIVASEATGQTASNPLPSVRRIDVEDNPMNTAQAAVPKVLEQLGLSSGEISPGRRSPNLTFSAEVDGEPVVLAFNTGNGFITTTPEASPAPIDTKSFMQRLHLSRGYSPHWNVAWLWALLVDGMFLSMAFWGLSGLFMWWQIKRTRWLGGGFIAASLAVTVLLVVGMHDNLTMAGARGRGQGGPGGGHGGPGGEVVAEGNEDEATGGRGMGGNRGGFGGNRGSFGGRGGFGGNRGGGGREGRGGATEAGEVSAEEAEAARELREFEEMLNDF